MSNRGIVIGVFVKKTKILSFLEGLKNNFRVNLDKVFVYAISTNKYEYLVTFKTYDKSIIKNLFNSTVMHVKNGCLFSINALNKLIEQEKNDSTQLNNEFIIDWNKYNNKLIIITKGKLSISDITKLEEKDLFFK